MPAITRFPGHQKFDDNLRLYFGSGASPSEAGDASIYFDGTNLLISGALVYSGAMNFDSTIDQDLALTAAGDGFNQTVTINHATAAVQGLDVSTVQLTTSRSSGVVDAALFSTTSLAGDSGGTYNSLRLTRTDGGGTVTHNAIYVESGFDVAIQGAAALPLRATSGSAMSIGDGVATYSMTSGALTASGFTTGTLTFSGLYTLNAGAGFLFDSTGAEDPITFRMGDDLSTSSFVIENNSLQDLLTITADAQHAAYIKDNSTSAWTVNEAGTNYLTIDTSNAGALVKIGNATTNPQVQLLGTGGATLGGSLTIGGDVVLDRSAANVLRLAAGDAFQMGTVQIHSGAGAPSGNLSGALTTASAMYLRNDAAGLTTVLYVTHNTGTNWGAVTGA